MKNFFVKMQGLGNDFIVFDARQTQLNLTHDRIRALTDRRMGIGADMVIVLRAPRNVPDAAVFMEIFNFDGSEVGACGNATRCVAGLLMPESVDGTVIIETLAGRLLACKLSDGMISVDMGMPKFKWQDIPLKSENNTENMDLGMPGLPPAMAVNMGNPHAVFVVENVEAIDLERYGPLIENHPLFPERTNVEFMQVEGPFQLRVRVWERGVGVTPACGSGACASALVAMRRSLINGLRAAVKLDGGVLVIEWQQEGGHVIMTGPWAEVYRGEIEV